MRLFKTAAALVLAAAIAFCAAVTVSAADSYLVLQGFAFDIRSGGAVIHDYDERDSSVELPRELLGAEVTQIYDNAFYGKTSVSEISFEKATGLRSIGKNAFCGCTGVSSLSIPRWVTEAGFGAFQGCTSLKSVSLGGGLTSIAPQLFYDCPSLKTLSLPDTITSIGGYAFADCGSLKLTFIPDSVTEIAPTAFRGSSKAVICCFSGSRAQEFAAEQGISCLVLDEALLGDANADGIVNIADVTAVQRHLSELEEISGFLRPLANVNGDDRLDVSDATLLQRYLAEYDMDCPVGQPVTDYRERLSALS